MFALLKKSGAAVCPAVADPSQTGKVMIKQRSFLTSQLFLPTP